MKIKVEVKVKAEEEASFGQVEDMKKCCMTAWMHECMKVVPFGHFVYACGDELISEHD